ncbi:MAG: Hpt domain-containing protein [bacterium]
MSAERDDNTSESPDSSDITPDELEAEKVKTILQKNTGSVLLTDDSGSFQPRDLGMILSILSDKDSSLLTIKSSVDWLPDGEQKLSSLLDDELASEVRNFLIEFHEYDDDNARGSIRTLMQTCDEMMDAMTSQPDIIESLDDKLWNWFQDPPEEPELESELTPVLIDFLSFYFNDDASDGEIAPGQGDTDASEGTSSDKAQQEVPAQSGETEEASPPESNDQSSASSDDDTFTMDLDADPAMVDDFLKEANEHLQQLDNLLVQAEQDPDQNTFGELFRSMHTLKGGFGFCGLEHCTDITHAAEDLLDELKEDPPDEIPPIYSSTLSTPSDSFVRHWSKPSRTNPIASRLRRPGNTFGLSRTICAKPARELRNRTPSRASR